MQNLNNVEIREYLKKKGVYQYVLADKMGVSESTLVKKFRKELPTDEKERIKGIIDEIVKEREGEE